MLDMLIVYITCENIEQARELSSRLLENRLCACVNIYPDVQSMYLWPPLSGKIDGGNEVVIIAKTIESKYTKLESAIHAFSKATTPCIIALPVKHVTKKYYEWLVLELAD